MTRPPALTGLVGIAAAALDCRAAVTCRPRQIDGDLIADSDQLTALTEASSLFVGVAPAITFTPTEQDPP